MTETWAFIKNIRTLADLRAILGDIYYNASLAGGHLWNPDELMTAAYDLGFRDGMKINADSEDQ